MSNNLLFFNTIVEENLTDTIALVATILVAVIVIALFLVGAKHKLKTVDLVYAGVAVSASFVLSFIKIAPVQYGGSITLASFVPLIIYAYYFGFFKALLAGLVYGVLQFIQSPYILTPLTFILDYLLAFACICLASLGKKITKNQTAAIALGALFAYAGRFIMHFLSGIVYFDLGQIWVNLPAVNAFSYSLLYQIVYLIPDAAICIVVLILLSHTKAIEKLQPKSLADVQEN